MVLFSIVGSSKAIKPPGSIENALIYSVSNTNLVLAGVTDALSPQGHGYFIPKYCVPLMSCISALQQGYFG